MLLTLLEGNFDMEHQWYVLQVFSNFEHKVQRTLTDRIEIKSLQSEITDVVVPIEEVVELKGGEKKTTERKFFPGMCSSECYE